jgi:hypothetical protein
MTEHIRTTMKTLHKELSKLDWEVSYQSQSNGGRRSATDEETTIYNKFSALREFLERPENEFGEETPLVHAKWNLYWIEYQQNALGRKAEDAAREIKLLELGSSR